MAAAAAGPAARRPHYETRPFAALFCAAQQEERATRTAADWRWRRRYQWGVAAVTGVLAGALAFGLNWVTEALQLVRFKAAVRYISPRGGFAMPWLAFTGISSAYAALVGLAVALLAPVAAGSGVPQMKAYINGVAVPGAVSPLTLLVKALGVTLSIGAGLVAGKEGPYIHSGGIVGALTGESGGALVRRWARRRLRSQRGDAGGGEGGGGHGHWRGRVPWWVPPLAAPEPREQSDYASVGTAAGVGVAFFAPVAGMAYAAEEGHTVFSVPMLWKACLAAACGVGVLQVLGGAEQEGGSLWSFPLTVPTAYSFAAVNETWSLFWWYTWELPFLVALGALGGLLGALWSAACCRLLALRARWIPPTRPALRVAEVVAVAALTATVWLAVCYASPCAALPPSDQQASLASINLDTWLYFDSPTDVLFPQLWCQEGEYSTWGQLFFMPLEASVRALFTVHPPGGAGTSPPDTSFLFSISSLFLFLALAFCGLLLVYGVAAPTGIFIPTLGIGAAAGRLAGRGVQAAVTACGYSLQVSLPAWSAVGAAGLLAGNTRLLLSVVLIVTETSGCSPVLVPIILVTVVGWAVAEALAQGVYDYQIEQAGYILVQDDDEMAPEELPHLLHAQAGEAMTPAPLCTVPERPSLGQLLGLLQASRHSLIPVVPDAGVVREAAKPDATKAEPTPATQLLGVVHRWQLLSVLRHPGLLRLLADEVREGTTACAAAGSSVGQQQGAAAAAAKAAGGSVALCLPTPVARRLSREQQLVLLSLLAQGPGALTAAQEGELLSRLSRPSSGSSCSTGVAGACGAGGEGRQCAQLAQRQQQQRSASEQQLIAAQHGSTSLPDREATSAGSDGGGVRGGPAAAAAGLCVPAPEEGGQAQVSLQQRVDLSPLIQRQPFCMGEGAPMAQVQHALRRLGLHSMLVQGDPRLLGVITRSDLLKAEGAEL